MKDQCKHFGHDWAFTAARGWFGCRRVVDTKVTKRNPIGQSVYCGAAAHCPGCLGYRLEGYEVVMCRAHTSVNIQLLPLMPSAPGGSFPSLTGKQQSLW